MVYLNLILLAAFAASITTPKKKGFVFPVRNTQNYDLIATFQKSIFFNRIPTACITCLEYSLRQTKVFQGAKFAERVSEDYVNKDPKVFLACENKLSL